MQFLESEITELTLTVWETVLQMSIEPNAEGEDSKEEGETVSACVHISGGWSGSVIVSCPSALAIRVACQMFELEPDEVEDDLVYDAIGEVVNMIGGNVKALVDGPSQLSLPAVATGIHTKLAVPGSSPVTTLGFKSETLPVRVVLTKKDEVGSHDQKSKMDKQPSPAQVV